MIIGRTYIKIFLVFWLVAILTLLGYNIVLHYFGPGSDKHLSHNRNDDMSGPGGLLLKEIVSDAVNYDYVSIIGGLEDMPSWATRYFFLINAEQKDLLQRPVPEAILNFSNQLTDVSPTQKDTNAEHTTYGRLFYLSDGTPLKLVVISTPDTTLRWRLYFKNMWHVLLVSLILSGAACFYLARFMTRDIHTLKLATQQIARGNWDTRVAEKLGDRPGEISDLGRAFDNMVVKLQKTMLEQRRLIKDVSHELRTPLARLQVALAIAQKRANSEITEELERIKRATDYLNDLISNILSVPLTEQESWDLDDVVEISSLLEVIVDLNTVDAKAKSVRLVLDNELGEALIQTRGQALVGVFGNVIRNAIHYTAENTDVEIRSYSPAEGICHVAISDKGPGVDPQYLDDIFEPFFRTDEARCRKKGGYGLGLAIAKRTVELHNGSISAVINATGGLTIIIELPCDDVVMLISERPEQ